MQRKTSPIFQAFEQQHREAKELFLALGKQIKSKKSIELYTKLSFLELYSDLMAKIHFEKEGLQFDFFTPFKPLQKNLRKVHHLKLVQRGILGRMTQTGETFNSYSSYLEKEKKGLYTETFDQIIGSPLKDWDEFLLKSLQSSNNIKPLTINTAINQLIQEELEYFQLDKRNGFDSKGLKDIFEGLRKIIMLENLLIHLGFNSIFVEKIHQEIEQLKEKLKPWYANHLELQSLTYFLSDKENVSKKYIDWVKDLRDKKKSLSSQVEKQALSLFQKILD
ncbi:MAG: hypothetical protein ACQEW9_04670 [Bacteroidota bacterium]|uniref:CHAD domain-containing protein n=1 Tax=Algoriphagus faecimaris TaxID=686796 RepID=A0A1G6RC27_9BACT|nr:hypothetical protein [Algoriphagus faecimaris]SDD01635.1 hypothetical protein SAMN04488104_101226 [Algoriphagus faecimaris]